MKTEKTNTKSKNVTLRVDAELWNRFKKACKLNDSDASKEVRRFIKKYLSENSQLTM